MIFQGLDLSRLELIKYFWRSIMMYRINMFCWRLRCALFEVKQAVCVLVFGDRS